MYVNDQGITIKVRQMNETWVLASFIYASCLKRIRRDLWRHLSDIQQERLARQPCGYSRVTLILLQILMRSKEVAMWTYWVCKNFRTSLIKMDLSTLGFRAPHLLGVIIVAAGKEFGNG